MKIVTLLCLGIIGFAVLQGCSVKVLFPNEKDSSNLTSSGGKVIPFQSDAAGPRLWVTNGTAGGTTLLSAAVTIDVGSDRNKQWLYEMDGKTYFVGCEIVHGCELWVTDGTTSGTKLLKDINLTSRSDIRQFAALNGKLYFSAQDGINGRELWMTDGTEAGTSMVFDLNPGAGDGFSNDSYSLLSFGGKIYFEGDDGTNGQSLYVTDGTLVGTTLLAVGSSYSFTSTATKLYFNHNGDLWQSDGTIVGTTQAVPGLNPDYIKAISDTQIMFMGDDGSGSSLFVSDGTVGGTQKLKAVDVHQASVINHLYYFKDGADGSLWKSDGTLAGTQLVQSQKMSYYFAYGTKILMLTSDDAHAGKIAQMNLDGSGTETLVASSMDSTTMLKSIMSAMATGCISIAGSVPNDGGERCCSADCLTSAGLAFPEPLYPPSIVGAGRSGFPGTDYGFWCYGGPRDCTGNAEHPVPTSVLMVSVSQEFCKLYNQKQGLGFAVISSCSDTSGNIYPGAKPCYDTDSLVFPDVPSQTFCYYRSDSDYNVVFDTTLTGFR